MTLIGFLDNDIGVGNVRILHRQAKGNVQRFTHEMKIDEVVEN